MASSRDVSERLSHLEQILAQRTPASTGTDANAVDVHLASVPTERIRRLTTELEAYPSRVTDEVDAVIIRLLLNEYATAVSHLRTVARIVAARVDGTGPPMREARRALHRHTKSVRGATPSWLPPK